MAGGLMQGFPPQSGDQVTLSNWRQAPFSQWGFQHAREVVPTAPIQNGPGDIWLIDAQPKELGDVEVSAPGVETTDVASAIEATDTDGLIVLHRGRVVTELYRTGMTEDTLHIIFSVSKSLTGIVAGILEARGLLDPEAPLEDYIPELESTAYKGAQVRHLLDMTTGIAFEEDYLATEGAIIRYRESTGWNPKTGDGPGDLRSFLLSLDETEKAHGGQFRYLSPNSDLLGWVLERASGTRFSDLMSELLWQPLGAQVAANVTVDPLGAPRTAGGISVTLRDLARVGQLLLQGGERDEKPVVPYSWIEDTRTNGDPEAWAKGDFASAMPPNMSYRNQWYVRNDRERAMFGIGIHGQYIYVDPARDTVIAKHSSQPEPLEETKDNLSLAMFDCIAAHLAG
jgi:CubicO group peptidase (beta-lactamase class C family)